MYGRAPHAHGTGPRAVDSAYGCPSLPQNLQAGSASLALDESRVLGADASQPARRGVAAQIPVH
eukprot:5956593-Pyramimonas_sp.AAC.1